MVQLLVWVVGGLSGLVLLALGGISWLEYTLVSPGVFSAVFAACSVPVAVLYFFVVHEEGRGAWRAGGWALVVLLFLAAVGTGLAAGARDEEYQGGDKDGGLKGLGYVHLRGSKKTGLWQYWHPGWEHTIRVNRRGGLTRIIGTNQVTERGPLRAQGEYVDGKENGLWVYLDKDGGLLDSTGWYRAGLKVRDAQPGELESVEILSEPLGWFDAFWF